MALSSLFQTISPIIGRLDLLFSRDARAVFSVADTLVSSADCDGPQKIVTDLSRLDSRQLHGDAVRFSAADSSLSSADSTRHLTLTSPFIFQPHPTISI